MKKDLLKLLDLTGEDIKLILDTSDKLKAEWKSGKTHDFPPGKTLAMIFAKNSTRTRVSFEVGMTHFGGHAIFMTTSDSQMKRGEAISDTARTLSRYVDCIMIRTFDQNEVEELAKHSTIPVINGLTDFAHPCQILADLMTIREHKGKLEGLKICWMGDGNNVANSLIVGALKCGMEVSVACPKGYEPDKEVLDFAAGIKDCKFKLTDDPKVAAAGADVVFTDVWASMGQEDEAKKRQEAFKGYQLNDEIMALTNPGCMVQHCLPAHKGEEISEKVFEEHAQEIFDEAENRLHVQKGIMYLLMKK
ncbi:MAG: ornithine carbamoyltransferase [Oscillospiraceae bacterium]|jgi:ornithine carbamoyltransferase|nr:ornithine carbamoyltransferase [Oscillospiraceae bacterium]